MSSAHRYSLHLHDDSDLTLDVGRHSLTPGGWVDIGPVTINAVDMAALADTLDRASKMARSVAADQQYEQGEAES
jgi:hypothetical protein